MSAKEIIEKKSVIFICLALLENLIVDIEKHEKRDAKQELKAVLKRLQKYNRITDKSLNSKGIDFIDSDSELLLKLIHLSYDAEELGKESEFVEHCKRFFE